MQNFIRLEKIVQKMSDTQSSNLSRQDSKKGNFIG